MQKIELSRISSIISRKEDNNLDEINLAIDEINKILNLEKVRLSQIETKLEEVLKPNSISMLQDNLEDIKRNIKSLKQFTNILITKKMFLENPQNENIKVLDKIDYSNASTLSKYL